MWLGRTHTTTVNGSKCKTSGGNTRRLGETPQCDEQNFHRVSFELRGVILHRITCNSGEHPARGGSAAAHGKRSVFPERRGSNFLVTSHFISFIYKTTNAFDGTSNRSPNLLENNLYVYQGCKAIIRNVSSLPQLTVDLILLVRKLSHKYIL